MEILNLIHFLHLEALGQSLLAAFLGATIGIEREIARKSAGMRTYALMSMGAALFSLLSALFFEQLRASGAIGSFDPSRIASQIVVGVGFIGGGLIIFRESKVQGLTTAAGIWVAAAIGTAVGMKFYDIAIFTSVLTVTIFVLLWNIEEKIVKKFSAGQEHDIE